MALAVIPLTRVRGAVALTTLYDFGTTTAANGAGPSAGLIRAKDGNFYGTTAMGGTGGDGTIFQITPAGVLTVLHTFNGPDGVTPAGGLLQASDGNFYGVTQSGGTSGDGTIFRLAPDGTFTSLHSFSGDDGSKPVAGLIQATDGNLYGAAGSGGDDFNGVIFRVTPDGAYSVVHRFQGTDGQIPSAALLQAADGNLYGTTSSGGASNNGTIFQLTPGGTLTTLHAFDGSDGASPVAPLIQGVDGDFYGTTASGGPGAGFGTIFRMTPDTIVITLHSFDGTAGGRPTTALLQGRDGNFYGTSPVGGPIFPPYDYTRFCTGAVFSVAPDGFFTTLHNFYRPEGVSPGSALIQDADGVFYGTAVGMDSANGATVSNGSVFRLTVDASTPPPAVSVAVANNSANAFSSAPLFTPTFGTVVVTLSSPASGLLKVKYTVGGSAEAGKDYLRLSGKVKFKAGQLAKVVYITPKSGAGRKDKRVVKIRLAPGNGYTLATPTPAKVKITPSP